MSITAIYIAGSGLLGHVHPTDNVAPAIRAYEGATRSEQEEVYEGVEGVEAIVVTIDGDGEAPKTLGALRAMDDDAYVVETGLKTWKAERHMTVTIYGEGDLEHLDQPGLPEMGYHHSKDHDLPSRAERDAKASELLASARTFFFSTPDLRAGKYRVTVTDYGWSEDGEIVHDDVVGV